MENLFDVAYESVEATMRQNHAAALICLCNAYLHWGKLTQEERSTRTAQIVQMNRWRDAFASRL